MLIADSSGTCGDHRFNGYFFYGTRYLKKLSLQINGEAPYVCSHGISGNNILEFSLIYPEVKTGGTGGSGSGMINRQKGILERSLTCFVRYTIRPAGFDIELSITNTWNERASVTVGWLLDADFESFENVQNRNCKGRGKVSMAKEPRDVHFCLENEALGLRTIITPSGADYRIKTDTKSLETELDLFKKERACIGLSVRAVDPQHKITEDQQRERENYLYNWIRQLSRLDAADKHHFTRIFNDSVELVGTAAGLDGSSDEWMAPYAGYPLYPFLFGRDALTSTWMIALYDHGRSLDHTLTKLGRLQGCTDDPWRDEEPGRIIQQARMDIPSRLGENPFLRYYGDFASPLMYVISMAYLYACTGNLDQIRKHWDTCCRILNWAERMGDPDGDGYLEYTTRSPDGPRNQGWKDSENAVVYEDGTLVEPPIATCEIQGYYYAALQTAYVFSFALGAKRDAFAYYTKAASLKKNFNRDFWVEDGGYIGFGLDSQKRLIRGKTSNIGHCLAAGIIDKKKVPFVVRNLFTRDMFSGWGIRTLSSNHAAYNPLSYHLGTVWPVENATIALGLRRYGYTHEAMQLVEANYDLASLWYCNRVPECIGGYDRTEYGHPGSFPKANAPQVWNGAAFGLFLQVMLGMQPVAPFKTLFVDPALPAWLPQLTIRSLRIGDATVSIEFRRRRSGRTTFKILEKTGTLHVLRQPPVNSLSTSLWGRTWALVKGR
ncbi:MAG: hypothetical protein GF401_08735 [Chitinivibrionales bacterium]|nr:hypothetical protein [Chitinivibrionales bacterium]